MRPTSLAIGILALLLPCHSMALDEVIIEIKEHLFYPANVKVPANQKVKITFINHDDKPEEIDSFDLNREKVIFAKSKASIFVGPLQTGTYRFFGEFNPSTAIGTVTAVDKNEVTDAH